MVTLEDESVDKSLEPGTYSFPFHTWRTPWGECKRVSCLVDRSSVVSVLIRWQTTTYRQALSGSKASALCLTQIQFLLMIDGYCLMFPLPNYNFSTFSAMSGAFSSANPVCGPNHFLYRLPHHHLCLENMVIWCIMTNHWKKKKHATPISVCYGSHGPFVSMIYVIML